MTDKKYLSIQFIIILVPPTIFAALFPVWDDWCYLKSLYGYVSGISGLILFFILEKYIALGESEFLNILPIISKLVMMYLVYLKIITNGEHVRRSITINVIFSIWNLLFGTWFMFISQQ